MNRLTKLLTYSLLILSVFFLTVAISVPFDADESREDKIDAALGCLLIGGTAGIAGGLLLRSSRRSQNQGKALALEAEQVRLRNVLYQLIADKKGAFTLLEFAIAADIPPKIAEDFLNHQATAFNANFSVSEQGAVVYQFPIS
jgi:hypothetical protein